MNWGIGAHCIAPVWDEAPKPFFRRRTSDFSKTRGKVGNRTSLLPLHRTLDQTAVGWHGLSWICHQPNWRRRAEGAGLTQAPSPECGGSLVFRRPRGQDPAAQAPVPRRACVRPPATRAIPRRRG